jgi:type I site-specific restriction endonuclease
MATITSNQNAEQRARNRIDAKLAEAGWIVQHRMAINFNVPRYCRSGVPDGCWAG